MSVLLVIDDEPLIHDYFRLAFRESPMRVESAMSAAVGIEKFTAARPDVVILDVGLPDLSGLETFRRLHEIDPKVPVIFVTGGGTTSTAIEAMALGAYEYLLKPLALQPVLELIERAEQVGRLMRVAPAITEGEVEAEGPDALVGRCPAMHEVFKSIGRVAPQDATVLILGESGTGKELVARAIYQFSRRAHRPFLAINCAAIPEALLESELFGHEKGAFTGATQRRIGKFEQCSGGTLFLDEIGDMTPLTQAKVLRVLQNQHFERVGGNETIATDVRVIAATNRDLEALATEGKFREDLYYRLNVYAIRLPSLRERGDDLPLLVKHFLRRLGKECGKEGAAIAPEAMSLLHAYAWPGNVRELQSALQQALLHAAGPVIVPESLPEAIRHAGERNTPTPTATDIELAIADAVTGGVNDLYATWLADRERELLLAVLRHTKGNISAASKVLGIARATLRSRLTALGIAKPSDV